MEMFARSFGSMIGRLCWTPRRWLAVSMNPPVPGVDAWRNVSGDTHSAFPVELMTCSNVTFLAASFCGSTWTCSWRSRCPQIATLATPGTARRRGRIVQRASTPIWIGVSFFDESEIIDVRADDDAGCSICGGFETFGKPVAWLRRSCTTWRAR